MKNLVAIAAVAALSLGLAACSQSTETTRAVVESQGYTNVKVGGYAWFGCGQDDDLATSFTATGQGGHNVEGVVCSGFFAKGATVRIIKVS